MASYIAHGKEYPQANGRVGEKSWSSNLRLVIGVRSLKRAKLSCQRLFAAFSLSQRKGVRARVGNLLPTRRAPAPVPHLRTNPLPPVTHTWPRPATRATTAAWIQAWLFK